jgi:YbbR domain-containing protein
MRHDSQLMRFYLWFRERTLENKKLKLISIVLAFLLFAVSRQPQHDVMITGVPLEYTNIPVGLELTGNFPTTVNLRLRGAKDVVRSVTVNQLEVVADLSGKSAGERVIQLKASDVLRPEKVEVRRIDPPTIELKIEPTIQKTIAVEPQISGTLNNNFELHKLTPIPATIEIEGPESKVNQVVKLRTESVLLEGKQANFESSVEVETMSQGVRLVTQKPIQVLVEVKPKKNVE